MDEYVGVDKTTIKKMHLETFCEDVDPDADEQIFDEIEAPTEPSNSIPSSSDDES